MLPWFIIRIRAGGPLDLAGLAVTCSTINSLLPKDKIFTCPPLGRLASEIIGERDNFDSCNSDQAYGFGRERRRGCRERRSRYWRSNWSWADSELLIAAACWKVWLALFCWRGGKRRVSDVTQLLSRVGMCAGSCGFSGPPNRASRRYRSKSGR